MKYTKYPELKAELKELATDIRFWKDHRKLEKRLEIDMPLWDIQELIDTKKHTFRHWHIAYCLLRGRTYEQIELTCRVSPNFNLVHEIMEKHAQKTLCASA